MIQVEPLNPGGVAVGAWEVVLVLVVLFGMAAAVVAGILAFYFLKKRGSIFPDNPAANPPPQVMQGDQPPPPIAPVKPLSPYSDFRLGVLLMAGGAAMFLGFKTAAPILGGFGLTFLGLGCAYIYLASRVHPESQKKITTLLLVVLAVTLLFVIAG